MLCGQPEQNQGLRTAISSALSARTAVVEAGARRAARRSVSTPSSAEEGAEGAGDLDRVERLLDREDRLARLVLPAGDAAAAAVVEDRLLDLDLDELALLLDDDDVLEVVRPLAEARHVERPDHADLVGGDPEAAALGVVEAEEVEGVGGVEPRLAAGDDADLGSVVAADAAVDAVRAGEGLGGEALVVVQARLLGDGVSCAADVEAVLGAWRSRSGVTIFRRCGSPSTTSVTSIVSLTHFSADPGAGVARERPAEEAVVEHLLHAGGREDRHHRVGERELGVVQAVELSPVWSSPRQATTPP